MLYEVITDAFFQDGHLAGTEILLDLEAFQDVDGGVARVGRGLEFVVHLVFVEADVAAKDQAQGRTEP